MARLTFDEFQRRSKEITQEQQKSGTWYNDALTAIATTPVRTSKVSSFDDFLAQSNAISARNQAMDLLLGFGKDEDEDEKEPKNTKNSRVNLEPLATDQSAAGPMAGGIEEPRNARVNFQRLSSTYDQLVPDNDLAQPVRGIHYYNQLDTRPDAQKAPQELQQQDLWKQAANQIGGELRTAYSGVMSPAQRATEGERQKRLQGYSLIPSLPDYAENSRYRDNRDGEVRYNALSGMFTGGYADPQYAAINRQTEARGMREANAATTGAGFVGESQSELDMMTDQEIGIYNYLYATRGKEEADQYIEDIRRDLTARQNEERNTRYAEWAQEQPVAASAFSVVEGPYKALSFVGQLADYAEGESTPYGYGGNVDTNAGYNKFAQTSGAVRGAVGQQIQDKVSARYGDAAGVVANKGYQLFMSYLDSRYNALISGAVPFRGEMLINPEMAEGLSLGIMGAGAAADSMIEAKKRGLDDGQAFMLGLIGGAAEIVTEKYSLESLLDADLAKESAVRYLVKTMAAEGSEEMASDLINEVADLWVSGDQAEMRQEIAGYMAEGMTRGQATGKAIGRFALQVLESGLGGALMGGLGGGMMIGTNALGTRSAGRDIRNMGTETVQSVIDEGMQSPEGSYSRELAERAQKKQAAGKKLSAAEIGRLQQVNELQVAEEALAEDESLDQRAQDVLLDLARDKVAEETGVDMTQAVEEVPAESRQNEARAAETAQEETARAEEETSRSEARSEAAEAEDETEFVELGGEKETTSIPMQSRSLMTMRTRLTEAYEAQKKQAFDPAELEKVKSAFGTAGQKALTDNYKGEQMTAPYVRGFMAFYNAGLTGTRASDVSLGARTLISTDTAVRAWAAGRQDAQAKNAQLTAQKGSVAVVQNPGIDYVDAKTSEWAAKNGETARRVNQLTQALGMSMTVEDIIRVGKTGEANAQLLNARLTLSNNAEKRTATYRGENISNPVMWTIGHEVGHRLRELAPEAFDALAKTMPQEAVRDIEWQQYAYSKAGVDEKFESAAEEAAANYVADLLEGGQVLDEFIARQTSAGNRSLLQKIGDAIRNVYRDVKAYLSGDEARAIRQSIKKLEAALDAAAEQAKKNAKNGVTAEVREAKKNAAQGGGELSIKSDAGLEEKNIADGRNAVASLIEQARINEVTEKAGTAYDEETESFSPSYSLKTWNESDYVKARKEAAKEMAEALGISQKKALAYIDSVNSIAKIIAEDQARLDFDGAPGMSAFIGNTEYGGSIDFSTICKKRRLMTGTFSAIQNALGETALSVADILDIRNMMKERGYEVSCGLCYVEGSRANMGGFAKQFIELYSKHNPDAAWVPSMTDVNTPDGVERMRVQHPDVYREYETFWNDHGRLRPGDPNLFASQQKPKLYQAATEYNGEILNKFKRDSTVEEKNLNGGLRIQSFSDFEIIHLLDMMQVITDMSRVGLAGQAYTKVPDFAWALGDTGLKINLSLITKGLDENGRLIYDEVEGMPYKDAKALRDRYSDNVGTILVVFNDAQLKAAMADDFVDFIIPFHRSQWAKKHYEAMGLPAGTKDFTYQQNEKLIRKTFHEYRGRMVPDKATNYMPNEYWDFNKTGKENAEAYLRMCAENNKRPKFYKLLVNNGDGSYSLQPDGSTDGYWKLLIDFKMYNNEGKGVPQRPVRPDFNLEESRRMLEEYKGGHQSYPVAQDVVDDYVSKYKTEHKNAKFSLQMPVEETKDLLALHNLTADKLSKALALGGFPMPSIAVTRDSIPHTNFGDITLVMNKSTVDPKADRRNTVYSADAWTPTFPSIEYEADPKAESRLRSRYYEMRNKFGDEATRPLYPWGNYAEDQLNRSGGVDGVIERAMDDTDMMKLFLMDRGLDVPGPVTEESVTRIDDGTRQFYDHFINALGKDVFAELSTADGKNPVEVRREWWGKHGEAFETAYKDYMTKLGFSEEEIGNVLEHETVAAQTRKALEMRNYIRNGPETRKTTTNITKTQDAIRAAVDQAAYSEWLHELFDGLEKSRGIYNGRDRYTSSGNQRSFKATHYEVTLENIAKAMAAENNGNSRNVSGFHGVKSLRAGMAERFSSIAQMHEREGRLQHLTQEQADQINDALAERLNDILVRIYDSGTHGSSDNSFIEMDNIGETLMEVTELRSITPETIKRVFKKYRYNLDNALAEDVRELLFDVSQMPVNIFEAKPERAVRFDEVLAAIVPTGTDPKLVQQLRDAGVQNITEYEKDNDAERVEKVNQVEGAKFSLKQRDDEYMDAVERGDTYEMESLVRQAAKEWGAATDESGKKPIDLYHGTRFFGFTEFNMSTGTDSDGMIYASTKSNVAANYAGRDYYAGTRPIGRKFIPGATKTRDIIRNAETVYESRFHVLTDAEKVARKAEIEKTVDEIADRINSIDLDQRIYQWDEDYKFTNQLANVEDLFFTIQGWGEYDDELSREYLESAVNRFEDNLTAARNYISEHREEIKALPGGKDLIALVNGFDLFDAYVDISYTYRKLISGEEVLTNMRGGSLEYPSVLQEKMEQIHNIAAYHLYGNLGDKPLVVDAQGHDWLSIKAPDVMGDDKYHSTDTIAKKARAEGYTGVVFKNVYDGGDKADDYVFFNASQVKSADPVTYDDNGNVIPLSERFNPEKEDIRYSLKGSDVQKEYMKAGSPVKQYINSQTETKQFKRWFGDWTKNPQGASKIVDAHGNPKIVYHQTAGDFTVFSNENPVAGATDSETPNGYFFKDNDHDIGLGGNQQMAVYLNMRKPLHFKNREEANRWYQRHVDGYADLQNEMQRKLDPIDAEMNRLENEMFGDDVTDEKYDELNARWDELHDEMKAVEDDYRGRLRELLNEHFLENDSGYDGIILDYDGHRYVNGKRENVKSYIVFKNTQIKSATDNVGTFDESNPDIRYSLKGTETQREIAELREQVDRLRTNVERWKNETKRSDRQAVDPKVVERTARALAKEYTGSAKGADITKDLESLYNFISHGGDGKDELTFESAFDRALAIADTLVENAVTQDDEAYREYEALRRYCRETPFVLGPEDAANITDYSSWAKGNRGRLRVKRGDRTNVDSYYQEMAQEWPEFFDPDITDPADQIQRIRSVLDGLYTINEYNPFSEHMEDAKLYAANDIMDRFWDVPNVKKTFADRAEERLIRETSKWRERAEQNVQTERQKREEAVQRLKDHYKEVKARASERKADSQARTRLLKIAKRLQNKKLPAAGRALLDQYIGDLDTVSKSITGKTLDNLRELEDWYRAKTNPDSAEYDPDFIPDDATLKKLERLHQRRIADMTADEVADLTDILLNIENELRTSKQLIDQEDRRNVYHMGEEVIKDIYSTKGNDPGVRGAAGRFIAAQTLSPVRLMHKLTGYNDADPMYKLTQALNDGQRAAIDYERRAKIPFRELAADKAFNKMFSGKDADTIQVTGLTKDGAQTVTITPAMRVSLYLHSLNNQNLRHIRDGGITVPDAKLYAKGNIQEAYNRGVTIKLEPSQVRAITSRMTPKEREFARLVHNYFNGMSRTEINEVSEKLKGYSLAQVEDYFPIKTDRSFGKGEFESMKFDGTIEGMGWTKERQTGAANPIMLMDVNRVLDQSISQHAKYVGLAIPVRNFNKVWGVTTASYDAQGNRSSYESSVQQALKQRWGGTNYDAVEKMMTDLQNPRSGADNPWSKALSKLQSNYAGAVLTLNGSVAIKQTASYPTAAAVLGWEPLAKAMKNFGKVNLDLIEKYTPLQWYRSQGFSTRELGDMAKNPNAMNRLLSKPALNWVQGMDVLTTRKLWKASEYYVQANNKDVRRGTDEYYKAVADIYNRVIEETQPNYTTMQRPNMLRSDNDLLRAISMFKTQPFQNFNVIYDAAGNLRAKLRQGDEAAIKQAKKEFGWAVTSQAAQLAVFAGMTMLWQLFRGKKDKYDDDDGEVSLTSMLTGLSKDMIAGAASIVPFGGEAWEMIASKVFGEKYYGLDVSAIETVNDAVAGLQSADKLVSDMAQKIVDGEPVDAAGTWIKLKKVLGNVSKIAGAPVDNVLKLSSAIYRRGAIAAYGRYLGEYKALTVTSDPNTSTNRGAYYDLLYKASQTDQKQYVEMYKEMLESGAFTADQIKSGMEDRMKKTEGVNSVKDLSHRFVAPK